MAVVGQGEHIRVEASVIAIVIAVLLNRLEDGWVALGGGREARVGPAVSAVGMACVVLKSVSTRDPHAASKTFFVYSTSY